MSVLIKGMSMPTSCANCEWSRLSKMDLGMSCYCSIVKKTEDIDIARKGRMSICPLIEVPPHGRLIDADALTDNWYYASAALRPDGVKKVVCLDDIDNAQTIIEAEEES